MAEQMFDVFLSYNKEERASVTAIAIHLRDVASISPWFDPWEAIPGMSVTDNLMQGLEGSKTCAVFIGKSGEGPWQKSEIRKAIDRQKQRHMLRVIPVLLPDAPEHLDTSSFLLEFTWVDFRGKTLHDDHALWCLECGIRGIAPGRGRPTMNAPRREQGAETAPRRNITIDLPDGVTLELIAIPGGTFWMGSRDGIGEKYEHPRHQVTVAPFYMGKYPVTQAQWQAVMGKNPSQFKGADRPVESVSWNDTQEFSKKLNEIVETHGRASLPGGKFRLPSEAEWEYACRAGTETAYSFGDDPAQLGNYAWFDGNSGKQTHPVGQKQPNGFGLYDMHGNVYEWCEDTWHDNYDGALKDGSAWITGANEDWRVVRGGGYGSSVGNLRCAYRIRLNRQHDWNGNLGFRLVRSELRSVSPF